MSVEFYDRRARQIELVKSFSGEQLREELKIVTNTIPKIRIDMKLGRYPNTAVLEAQDYIGILENELKNRRL